MTTSTLQVREWEPEDAPVLARLREELAAAEGVATTVDAAEMAALLAQPGAGALVALAGGTAVGMLTYFVYPSLMRRAAWAQVAELIVTAAHRRRGIGRALLEEALCRFAARGLREASVSTRPDNTAATALYRTTGFARELRTFERPLTKGAGE